ncbi:MAG: hypothetical protein J0I80_06645 [Sphingomonas sp.]|nr:hypothetical protein [Sphingomonas sp.]
MSLPEGWAYATIADVAAINPKHDKDVDRGQLVSFVPMPAVDERLGAITAPTERTLGDVWTGFTHFAEGDVIFAKITPCMENGKAAVARDLTNGLACGSTEFYVMRAEDEVYPDFLWRLVRQKSFRDEAEQHMSGAVGQRRVPRQYLEAHALAVPPASEQRRIVAKLDALTARLARARAELDQVPVLAKKLREQAQAELWVTDELCGLNDFLAEPIRNGLSIAGSDQPPGVRALKLSALRGGVVNLDDVRYLPIEPERAEPYALRSGDLLVSRGNGTLSLVGKASLVFTDESDLPIFPDTAFRIRVDTEKVCAKWLLHVWNSGGVRKQIESVARTTAGIWKIAQRDLIGIELPRFGLERQIELASKIDAVFARADRLEAEAIRASALIDRLEASILAKAFRGEIVPQDPADEPASVLLNRIRAQRAAAPKTKRGRQAKSMVADQSAD